MAREPRTWTCRRQSGGVKCLTKNLAVKQKCTTCGSPRPARKRKAHFNTLKLPHEAFVLVNGGSENCGICGAPPTTKRNDRDHEHVDAGLARGLLCHRCNRVLGKRMESAVRQMGMTLPEWLRAAADYLERAERWRGINLEALL